ncbi:MAG: TonB-dependent receptor [Prolixibacteraceae bacterium]|jgi:TonB-linked SusC/RagA family outer membrane protein
MKKKSGNPICESSWQKVLFGLRLTAFLLLASFVQASAGVTSSKVKGQTKVEVPEQNHNFEQPQKKQLKGKVIDDKGGPVPGATVLVKGSSIGTITDGDGNFNLDVPLDTKTLVFSFVGMKPQELPIDNETIFNVVLAEQTVGLEEVVAVGYGVQKKASVVGSIVTTTDKELKRTANTTNLGLALVGNLPGVTSIQTSYQPGNSDPKIVIRGQSSWNNTDPYVLVDGVERRMNDIDINEVDNISVLKDASATAVFGVKGANGVILITTKRGSKGKTLFEVSANSTMVFPSLLLDKLDAYDAYMVKDAAIERESVINPGSWAEYVPLQIAQRYRNPGNYQNLKYPEAFPNIDWQSYMLKNFSIDSEVNLNASGGNDIVKYFSSLSFMSQGDLLKIPDIDNYQGGFGYKRFNFRSNLDINITKSTVLTLNLAGNYGIQKTYNTGSWPADTYSLAGLYTTPPDAYQPIYSDGSFGVSPTIMTFLYNPLEFAATKGYQNNNTTNVTSDISLNQNLDAITKGLNASARFSFDNSYVSVSGINAEGAPQKYIDPAIEDAEPGTESQYITIYPATGINQFPWVMGHWGLRSETPSLTAFKRRFFYQAQLNYARQFGKHDVAVTGVFNREQYASGSEFPNFRENWIGRATYNYDNRYYTEVNGAYNGSEKFGPANRFAFFPSVGFGWTLKNESFFKDVAWLDRLRLRYNFGFIGDDNISTRWLYMSQWSYGGSLSLNNQYDQYSPYTIYQESTTGNPNVHWEKAKKINYGLDLAVFKNLISITADYFTENRSDILLSGSQRVFPSYYSPLSPPAANVGRVNKNGYEVELQFRKKIKNINIWANLSMTHVVNKIIYKEEPLMTESYLLAAGYSLGQTKSLITDGFLESWDEVYGSTMFQTNDQNKIPGDFRILDFNANGVVESDKDIAANGYSDIPQNTYNSSMGFDYKGFSAMVQFYGVNNVTRNVSRGNFANNTNIAYAHALDYWSVDNPNGTSFLPRWKAQGGTTGDYYNADGSYIRLKNAEVAYTFDGAFVKNLRLSSLRLYVNGNNLLFWSKLVDDREFGNSTAYPSSKRINLGLDVKF